MARTSRRGPRTAVARPDSRVAVGLHSGPAAGGGPADANDQAGPNLVTAVQEQLGLKLEAKKGPVDLLVIDRAEKTPTEN